MKKIYNVPLTEVVKVNAEQMICQSTLQMKSGSITGDEKGFQKAGKDDDYYDDEGLW